VVSRIRCLNRSKAFGAIVRLISGPVLKLNPRSFRSCGRATPRSDPGCRSNPIGHPVRRKRQRLPPTLPIENASDRDPAPSPAVCPEAFPIKASDHPDPNPRLDLPSTCRSASGCWQQLTYPSSAEPANQVYCTRDSRDYGLTRLLM
jgi:hypothetical protein